VSDRVVRAMLALTVLALSVFYVVTKPPRLGLDLRGGTQIVLETRDSVTVKADRESTGQTLEVLRRRVDALGVSEPAVAQSGERRIIVELPGVHDIRQAAAVLGRTAQLTFHPVLGTARPPLPAAGGQANPRGQLVLADEGGQPLRLGPAGLTGEGVKGAAAQADPEGLGSEMISLSSTMATRLVGSPAGAQAALPVNCAQARPPEPRKSMVTYHGVRTAKAMGLRNLPSKSWQVNTGWVIAANIAADLAAWTRLLGFGDDPGLREAGPDTLRYRVWHIPAGSPATPASAS
jgi:SecD/SecF fusion protein